MKKKEVIVAIYIRVSTLDQAREGYSLKMQEQTLREWCKEKGYIIYDLYADRGISGKDFNHRPDMLRLMRDAKDGCFNSVVFWALSRFTRSVQDLYNTLDKFQKWGVSMVSYTEAFDTSTPMGRAMIGIVGVFAQLEREITSERVAAAMQMRAAQGKRTCSEILGYDKKGKDIKVIDIHEVSVIADYFVIASGSNQNQVQAMVDNVDEQLGRAGYEAKQVEGTKNSAWVLMDYGDVIIHVFDEENRLFYDLERIWRDGKELDVSEFLEEK